MSITPWIDIFLEEKNIDLEQIIEVEGESGTNYMPLEVVVDAIKTASAKNQAEIKHMLVKIDFYDMDVISYLKHLAQAIAI